jgi:hypothetical protein
LTFFLSLQKTGVFPFDGYPLQSIPGLLCAIRLMPATGIYPFAQSVDLTAIQRLQRAAVGSDILDCLVGNIGASLKILSLVVPQSSQNGCQFAFIDNQSTFSLRV